MPIDGSTVIPPTEATLMTELPGRSLIERFQASCVHTSAPRRFTSHVLS